MNPLLDTATTLIQRYDLAFAAWIEFALLPVAVPAVVALFRRRALAGRGPFVLPTAVRILGGLALVVLLVILPWMAVEMFFVPVALEAYPGSRSLLWAPLAVSRWVTRYGFLIVPLLWPVWVLWFSLRSARQRSAGPATT